MGLLIDVLRKVASDRYVRHGYVLESQRGDFPLAHKTTFSREKCIKRIRVVNRLAVKLVKGLGHLAAQSRDGFLNVVVRTRLSDKNVVTVIDKNGKTFLLNGILWSKSLVAKAAKERFCFKINTILPITVAPSSPLSLDSEQPFLKFLLLSNKGGSCIKPSKQKTSKELMTAFVGEKISFEMDRDWMSANRLTVRYREGVDFFLEFSAKNADNPDLVHCPCLKCGNMERMKIV
ncbi:hypothetical protein F8388_014793 [Cannabis sativa]|uniref:Transposase-associated domain-containing protein n=1 Tax=Cannabis sativa TaxID=3483 RepID=A0A7J6H0H8_CANSA|nr:hypothetical protein F8388_014793 [Cannabis sativa]